VVAAVGPIEIIVGLGDHPALEWINTWAIPAPGADVIELIGDGQAYLRWATRAGLVDEQDQAEVRRLFGPAQLDEIAAQARECRDRLRPVITSWSSDPSTPIPTEVIEQLNTLLAEDHRYARLHAAEHGMELREHRQWTDPAQLLVPLAEAAAGLLTEGQPGLVRQCEGCTVIFYDRTKAHRRRWCSMAICGNRAKVRRHRASAAGT
jgi:predicted RNA-binding Zn ribbon-like protein